MASNTIIMPQPAGKQFRSFPLYIDYGKVALLPDEHDLVLNIESGQFVLINWNVRYVIADGRFDRPSGELSLMFTLLSAWPSYVENLKLAQSITLRDPEEIEDLYDLAPDEALAPIRRHVERCRTLLHPLGIEIEDINGLGYKLSRYTCQGGKS